MMDDWKSLLQQAIEKHGQAEVARRLGVSPATVCLVSKDEYPANTKAVEEKILTIFGGKTMEQIPEGYKKNAIGHLVPVEAIKDEDLARDEFVSDMIEKAKAISAAVAKFKEQLTGDMQAFIELACEKYDANLGGARGNVTLTSFDGRYQILRAVSDQLDFDERLQAAKALIDECLREWTKNSDTKIRALIDQAFQVDKKGRINAKRILSLRSLKIDDEKWGRAMEAIGDSLTVIGSRTYFRIYERDAKGNYNQIPMDFSGM